MNNFGQRGGNGPRRRRTACRWQRDGVLFSPSLCCPRGNASQSASRRTRCLWPEFTLGRPFSWVVPPVTALSRSTYSAASAALI